MGVYGDAHRLFGDRNARLLAQIRSTSLGGPVGAVLPDFMGISLDHSPPFSFPGRGDRSFSTRGCAPWHRIPSTGQEALEHAYHRLLAASHCLGDLTRRLASQREPEHLVACACLGIGRFFRATAPFGSCRFLQ